jgi:general secretion pathway protein M
MADQERKMSAVMKTNKRFNEWKQSAGTFWAARNRRERNMLIAATIVIIVGLIYALLIDPALSGRKDLEKTLPAMRQQTAEVQALAREAGSLNTRAATPPPAVTKESIDSSLNGKGLKAQNVTVTGELVRVQLNGASFAGVVDWLADMQRSARLSVIDANIEAQAQADTVNANLTLRQQRNEQAQ